MADQPSSLAGVWDRFMTPGRKVQTTIDPETGERVFFSDADVAALGKKSGRVLDRLAKVIARLSGIKTGEDEGEEKN